MWNRLTEEAKLAAVGLILLALGIGAMAVLFKPQPVSQWEYDEKGKEVYDLSGKHIE